MIHRIHNIYLTFLKFLYLATCVLYTICFFLLFVVFIVLEDLLPRVIIVKVFILSRRYNLEFAFHHTLVFDLIRSSFLWNLVASWLLKSPLHTILRVPYQLLSRIPILILWVLVWVVFESTFSKTFKSLLFTRIFSWTLEVIWILRLHIELHFSLTAGIHWKGGHRAAFELNSVLRAGFTGGRFK